MKGMRSISRGTGFRGVLDYVFADPNAVFLGTSDLMMGTDVEGLAKDFHHGLVLRQHPGRYVWHSSLRLPIGEHVTPEILLEFSHAYMGRMGFTRMEALYAVIMHDDPDGQHAHIVASRVLGNGSLWLGQNENLMSTRVIHDLEREFGLTITKGVNVEVGIVENGKERDRLLKPDLKRAKRDEIEINERIAAEIGIPAQLPRESLLRILDSACGTASVKLFLETADVHGVQIYANVATTGKVSGLAFGFAGQMFKGSALGQRYAWSRLSRALAYSAETDLELLRGRMTPFEQPEIIGDYVRDPELVDLPGPPRYWAVSGPKGSVRYIRQSTNELAMIDAGRRITFKVQDYDTLQAGLRLAEKKWPEGFRIAGSRYFKLRLIERAVALGVEGKIRNEELVEEIAAAVRVRQRRINAEATRHGEACGEQSIGWLKEPVAGSGQRRSMSEGIRPAPAATRRRISDVEATKEDSDLVERITVRKRAALAIRSAELADRLLILTTPEQTEQHLRLDAAASQAYLALSRQFASTLPPTVDAMDPALWRDFDRERAAPLLLDRFGSSEAESVLTRISPAAVRSVGAAEKQALRGIAGPVIENYGSDLVRRVLNERNENGYDDEKRPAPGNLSKPHPRRSI